MATFKSMRCRLEKIMFSKKIFSSDKKMDLFDMSELNYIQDFQRKIRD